MKLNPKISAAVGAILSAPASMIVFAAPADQASETAADAGGLQEVIVTANRRAENLQDVPITIQALSGDTLKQLNITGFNDLLKYTPNVTFSGNGPGTGNIFMRGLGGSGSGNQSQSTTAPFPNVALYLDDQSMQFPARNNDVYLVDMERVEMLEGPQGTLFGGGAQAGAIRYITNKPKLGVTEGDANASYGITAGGDPNSSGNVVLNLPFGDNFALRGVIFTERQGGWIDNVPSTIAIPPLGNGADVGFPPGAGTGLPASRPGQPDRHQCRHDRQQPEHHELHRRPAVRAVQVQRELGHPGAAELPELRGRRLLLHLPEGLQRQQPRPHAADRVHAGLQQGQVLKHRLDHQRCLRGLKAVYTGSYMTRSIDGQQDYSNYMRSNHGAYYACSGKGASYFYFRSAKPTNCYAPVGILARPGEEHARQPRAAHQHALTSTACAASPAPSTRSSTSTTT